MQRTHLLLLTAVVLSLPASLAAKVTVTVTPAEATVALAQTQDFIAAVSGTNKKGVKFAVCDGSGANCVNGGNSAVGTIAIIGNDPEGNRIGRYIAPAALPASGCTLGPSGCRVKIRAKMTAAQFRKKKAFAASFIAAPATILRASVASNGSEGNRPSDVVPALSADGRYVAFSSRATNLVPNDTNGAWDVFLRDTCLGAGVACTPSTVLLSLADDGGPTVGGDSWIAFSMTPDARFVAFFSYATNLVPGDTNGYADVFVRDTCIGAGDSCVPSTVRVSLADDGSQAVGGDSWVGSLSADGRFVGFWSPATNLVPGDVNLQWDVFVRDTCVRAAPPCTPSTIRVSIANDGSEGDDESRGAQLSADGRLVAFMSRASNLAAGDTNGNYDVFVRDTCVAAPPGCAPSTVLVSVAEDGNPGNAGASHPHINSDGRLVGFLSFSSNLVPGDTNGTGDYFVRDTCLGATDPCTPSTIRVSVAADGSQSEGEPGGFAGPSLSADGRFAAFQSHATNLVSDDTNGAADIFLRDTCRGASGPCTPSTTRVSVAKDGNQANAISVEAVLSADGRFVGFNSSASNLVSNDTNGDPDVFLARTGAIRHSLAYVPNWLTNDMSVIDTGTNTVVATLTGFAAPQAVAFSPNGLRAYVINRDTDSLSVVNTLSNTVVATIAVGNRPLNLTVAPDGSRIYVVNLFDHTVTVISAETNTVLDAVLIGGTPEDVAVSRDGTRFYVVVIEGGVGVYETATNNWVTSIATGAGSAGLAMSPDGTRLYVVNGQSDSVSVIATSQNSVVATISVGDTPIKLGVTPDGSLAYVTNLMDNTVSVIRTSTAMVVATIPVGQGPHSVGFAPEGPYAYVSNRFANSVSVIDVARNLVIATVPVGDIPWYLAVRPVR